MKALHGDFFCFQWHKKSHSGPFWKVGGPAPPSHILSNSGRISHLPEKITLGGTWKTIKFPFHRHITRYNFFQIHRYFAMCKQYSAVWMGKKWYWSFQSDLKRIVIISTITVTWLDNVFFKFIQKYDIFWRHERWMN